jgi:hypothetical protein
MHYSIASACACQSAPPTSSHSHAFRLLASCLPDSTTIDWKRINSHWSRNTQPRNRQHAVQRFRWEALGERTRARSTPPKGRGGSSCVVTRPAPTKTSATLSQHHRRCTDSISVHYGSVQSSLPLVVTIGPACAVVHLGRSWLSGAMPVPERAPDQETSSIH